MRARDRLSETLELHAACASPRRPRADPRDRVLHSHEALLLPFEQALTRVDSLTGRYYGCSAHFLWIGDRTRQPDGAHVESCAVSRIDRPEMRARPASPDDLLRLIDRLNPGNIAAA